MKSSIFGKTVYLNECSTYVWLLEHQLILYSIFFKFTYFIVFCMDLSRITLTLYLFNITHKYLSWKRSFLPFHCVGLKSAFDEIKPMPG